MRALEPRSVLRLLTLVVLLACGGGLGAKLRSLRPERPAAQAALATIPGGRELAGLAGGLSVELKRFLAAAIFRRIDTYMHEGPVVHGGVGLAGNLELVALYRLVTLLDPTNLNAYILAGTHLIQYMNVPDEGVAVLEEGISANATDPRAKELLGQIALYFMNDRADFARARTYLEKVLALVRRHGAAAEEAHYVFRERTVVGMLVVACYRQGDLEAALRYHVQDHDLPPDNQTIAALDHVLRTRGQYRAPPPPAPQVTAVDRPSTAAASVLPWDEPSREKRLMWKTGALLAAALIVSASSLAFAARRP